MWPYLLATLGMSALKSSEDQKNYKQQQLAEAEKTRFSPWTGMQGQTLQRPSQSGTLMQGLMAGLMMGQQFGGGSGNKVNGQTNIMSDNTSAQLPQQPNLYAQDPRMYVS